MNEYLTYLAEKKANYYYNLYKSNKRAERKEECLKRITMIDEYILLLDIIEHLPPRMHMQVDREYIESLERVTLLNG